MTGDVSIKPNSTCMVMTTEILRSMLYRLVALCPHWGVLWSYTQALCAAQQAGCPLLTVGCLSAQRALKGGCPLLTTGCMPAGWPVTMQMMAWQGCLSL